MGTTQRPANTIRQNSNTVTEVSNKNNLNMYLRIDSAIMRAVNKGVRAWNWTTGRTKADLANTMINANTVLQAAGWWLVVNPYVGFGSGAVWAFVGSKAKKQNIIANELEEEALKNETHSTRAWNPRDKFPEVVGPFCCMVGLGYGIGGSFIRSDRIMTGIEAFAFGGVGLALGPSFYVMRADNVPRRENVIARSFEHYKKWRRTRESKSIAVTGLRSRSDSKSQV